MRRPDKLWNISEFPKENTAKHFNRAWQATHGYTDVEINKMPEKGIKKLAVVTPAFVSDCLETLEEIAMEANHEFKVHGGEEFMAIPCMNDGDEWCETVSTWIKDWASK